MVAGTLGSTRGGVRRLSVQTLLSSSLFIPAFPSLGLLFLSLRDSISGKENSCGIRAETRVNGPGGTGMPLTPSHKGAVCSDCQGRLEDAVTAACGHTFCRLCLPLPPQMGAQPSSRVLLCPVCQEKEQTEPVLVPVPLGPLGETYCEEHGEKIYFFCENDAEFLCVFCREGPSHQAHAVGFLDEAIQPYRVRGMGSAWGPLEQDSVPRWGVGREQGGGRGRGVA